VIENLVSAGEHDRMPVAATGDVNMVWRPRAIVVAVNGTIIENFPTGVFLIPSLVVFVAAMIVIFGKIEPGQGEGSSSPSIQNLTQPSPEYRERGKEVHPRPSRSWRVSDWSRSGFRASPCRRCI